MPNKRQHRVHCTLRKTTKIKMMMMMLITIVQVITMMSGANTLNKLSKSGKNESKLLQQLMIIILMILTKHWTSYANKAHNCNNHQIKRSKGVWTVTILKITTIIINVINLHLRVLTQFMIKNKHKTKWIMSTTIKMKMKIMIMTMKKLFLHKNYTNWMTIKPKSNAKFNKLTKPFRFMW